MNFIFISPQFPHTYWQFCHHLKQNGVNVFGIADSPYETQIEAVVPIQLSTGTTYARVRQALNIKDNPQRLYSKVAVFGKICPYMNVAGMKNTRDYKLLE